MCRAFTWEVEDLSSVSLELLQSETHTFPQILVHTDGTDDRKGYDQVSERSSLVSMDTHPRTDYPPQAGSFQ